jgi:hypothetical protein
MKTAISAPGIPSSDEIKSGDSSVPRITLDSEATPIAVKKARNLDCVVLSHREAAVLTALKQALVLELRTQVPTLRRL